MEIINSNKISEKERWSRIELIKKLAYKCEVLLQADIIAQYANFIHKVEKGEFRWGSKSALRQFEQQLVYNMSVDRKKGDRDRRNEDKKRTKGVVEKRERNTVLNLIGVHVH